VRVKRRPGGTPPAINGGALRSPLTFGARRQSVKVAHRAFETTSVGLCLVRLDVLVPATLAANSQDNTLAYSPGWRAKRPVEHGFNAAGAKHSAHPVVICPTLSSLVPPTHACAQGFDARLDPVALHGAHLFRLPSRHPRLWLHRATRPSRDPPVAAVREREGARSQPFGRSVASWAALSSLHGVEGSGEEKTRYFVVLVLTDDGGSPV
jgi:hypothetical protein